MASGDAIVNRKSKDVKRTPVKYPLWFGGSSSALAALISHPLDLGMSLMNSRTLPVLTYTSKGAVADAKVGCRGT